MGKFRMAFYLVLVTDRWSFGSTKMIGHPFVINNGDAYAKRNILQLAWHMHRNLLRQIQFSDGDPKEIQAKKREDLMGLRKICMGMLDC